ncbi:MAG: aspartate 4-decarboxylase, partial [Firmicutes bacterium]|nr:aspartate 4-decarboxylase [Bacillota bacterium]
DDGATELLRKTMAHGVSVHHFDADEWVHELVDGIIGDNYPTPDRMLPHAETIVREFLCREVYGVEKGGAGIARDLQLFAVEGATAAMCYVFDSLRENYLLAQGDHIALMTPIFTPYLEIPKLDRYSFRVTEVRATGETSDGHHTWQYPLSELQKVADPSVKALFLVNPSNPPSVAMSPEALSALVQVIRTHNPNLMIICDDVYGTFVPGYRSLVAALPRNTLSVYSFSKHFGVTGWRLGVIALCRDSVFDRRLAAAPADLQAQLARRYGSVAREPQTLSFMDRLVADSRQVALNHTAGLSTPQQVQMALFAAFSTLDRDERYKRQVRDICRRRRDRLYASLGLKTPELPHDAAYYTEFDLLHWASGEFGDAFANYLEQAYNPLDVLFRLAQESAVVVLGGGGFHAPKWSVRVSLANLDDDAYDRIGQALRRILGEYAQDFRASEKSPSGAVDK